MQVIMPKSKQSSLNNMNNGPPQNKKNLPAGALENSQDANTEYTDT